MAKRPKRPASASTSTTATRTASPAVAPGPSAPPVQATASRGERRIAWQSVITVLSAAILIGAEVFGGAFAGGWALANLLDLGPTGVHILQGLFFIGGLAVMVTFVRHAQLVEPFFRRD